MIATDKKVKHYYVGFENGGFLVKCKTLEQAKNKAKYLAILSHQNYYIYSAVCEVKPYTTIISTDLYEQE